MSNPLLQNEYVSLLQARLAAKNLLIYSDIRKNPVVRRFLSLLDRLEGGEAIDDSIEEEGRLFASLAESVEFSRGPVIGNAWQNHLLELILDAENLFSRKAEVEGLEAMGTSLIKAVENDLRCLQTLFNLDLDRSLKGLMRLNDRKRFSRERDDDTTAFSSDLITSWGNGFKSLPPREAQNELTILRSRMKRRLAESKDWSLHIEELARYYHTAGSGIFGRYLAFRWVHTGKGGYLEGIEEPDPIRLEDLIGYETERNEVIRNTEQFVRGYPANNMLLYGDRGTGKSSTVKALIHRFGGLGLRLIEVSPQDLRDFPKILGLLRRRAGRFILFIDDLSFDEDEKGYKHLKAILEGGIEIRPANVLIYATSNRRHLVKERFSDSEMTHFNTLTGRVDDEIHREDTIQEKLSLADRFGITVTFSSPDQKGYLEIVEGLARQRKLPLPLEELRRRALQWELWHNGRSGRTARQFIDQLEGELALAEEISKR